MTRSVSRTERTLATLGLIISMLFVGWEIRQNTQVARAAAIQATGDQIIQWQTEVGLNDDWIRIISFLREGGQFEDLTPEDRQRYSYVVSATVRIMELRYRQMQMGIIAPEDMGAYGGTSNPYWFRSSHFLAWWNGLDAENSWSPDFLEFFETVVLGIREPGQGGG